MHAPVDNARLAPNPNAARASTGDFIVFFAMRTAVARLGGIAETARLLGQSKEAVAAWVAPTRRTRPEDPILEKLAQQSSVSLECLQLYFNNLETYKRNESFRRRRTN